MTVEDTIGVKEGLMLANIIINAGKQVKTMNRDSESISILEGFRVIAIAVGGGDHENKDEKQKRNKNSASTL